VEACATTGSTAGDDGTGVAGFDVETFPADAALAGIFSADAGVCFTVDDDLASSDLKTLFGMFEDAEGTGDGVTGAAGLDVEPVGADAALAEIFSAGADACCTVDDDFTGSDFTAVFGTGEDAGGTCDDATVADWFGVEPLVVGTVLIGFFSPGAAEAVGINDPFIAGSEV
jgi:hypothetical protein